MVATTLVAWSLSAYQPVNGAFVITRVEDRTWEPMWDVMTNSRRGAMFVRSDAVMMRRPNSKPRQAPHWSRASVAPTREDVEARLQIVERAYGWPRLSHFHRRTTQRGYWRANVEWRVTIPWLPRYGRTTTRALPLAPIWPGFGINTVVYAAILWLLALAPFTARRMIRRKRGRCIKCGYDLRGDFSAGCSECGWRRLEKDAQQSG